MAAYFVAFLVLALPAVLGVGEAIALTVSVVRATPNLVTALVRNWPRGVRR